MLKNPFSYKEGIEVEVHSIDFILYISLHVNVLKNSMFLKISIYNLMIIKNICMIAISIQWMNLTCK